MPSTQTVTVEVVFANHAASAALIDAIGLVTSMRKSAKRDKIERYLLKAAKGITVAPGKK